MGRIRDRGNDGGDVYRWQTLARFVNTNGWKRGAELGIHDGVNYRYLINNCPNLHLIGVDLYEAQPEKNTKIIMTRCLAFLLKTQTAH